MIIREDLALNKKLEILGEAARYDVACTSSGSERGGNGRSLGNTVSAGLCHSFTSDGRCISLLKILLTNECIYSCRYCINRAQNDILRTTFTPEEASRLTIEFYRRNYIEGLFLSSGIYPTPNASAERMLETVRLLRLEYDFQGYIHVKAIPGADPSITAETGWYADRMSVNLELPTADGLRTLAPNKNRRNILAPMRMIQNARHIVNGRYLPNDSAYAVSRRKPGDTDAAGQALPENGKKFVASTWSSCGIDGGTSAASDDLCALKTSNTPITSNTSKALNELNVSNISNVPKTSTVPRMSGASGVSVAPGVSEASRVFEASRVSEVSRVSEAPETHKTPEAHTTLNPSQSQSPEPAATTLPARPAGALKRFVPAGQSTQMIIGATDETDYQIMSVTESLYRNFELKRVYYSSFINVNHDSSMPDPETRLIMDREHRLYQADFLLRYYKYDVEDLLSAEKPNFNLLMDPKCDYALRHLELFPVEINRASYDLLLKVPGIGVKSAKRIVTARRTCNLRFEDLKKIGVTLKRAAYFITCRGRMMFPVKLQEDALTPFLIDEKKGMILNGETVTYKQLSLFDFCT